jgi:hypothetical protein
MAVKSTVHVAGSAATLLVTGTPGDSNVQKKVALIPADAILIGGIDAQTFPVSTTGIALDLVSGDSIYVKRAGGSDVNVDVLEVSI